MKQVFSLVFFLLALLSSEAEQRIALVVGNAEYEKQANLKNPLNDAKLMKGTFEKLGFKVHVLLNATGEDLLEGVRKFHESLTPGCTAAIYYSGHGAQVDHQNYLLPVDLDAHFKYELKRTSPSLKDLLSVMENADAGLKLVFLDCCRNVPKLMTKERSSKQGLAAFETESDNTLVSYATKHGMVAFDDPHLKNSLYSSTLSVELLRPGLVIEEALRRVAKTVYQKSGRRQRPWTYGNLLDPVYLAGREGESPPQIDLESDQKSAVQEGPADLNQHLAAIDETWRIQIQQMRSAEPSQVYFGEIGGVKAAVSMQWLDNLDAIRGSIFPITEERGLEQQWQFIGTNFVQGEIEISIFENHKLLTTGAMRKVRVGDDLSWVGKTNSGKEIRIARKLQRSPVDKVHSKYRGKVGTSAVLVTLDWESDRKVSGSYKSLASGKSYELKGDNTLDGFLYLDEIRDGNLTARILLEKTRLENQLVWAGQIFNPDGRINPVVLSRE